MLIIWLKLYHSLLHQNLLQKLPKVLIRSVNLSIKEPFGSFLVQAWLRATISIDYLNLSFASWHRPSTTINIASNIISLITLTPLATLHPNRLDVDSLASIYRLQLHRSRMGFLCLLKASTIHLAYLARSHL